MSDDLMARLAKQLKWESVAALSSAEFVKRYVQECCRHTEAVSECPHCNLLFLASFTTRAVELLALEAVAPPRVDSQE